MARADRNYSPDQPTSGASQAPLVAVCYPRQSKTDAEELAAGQSLSSETQIDRSEQFARVHGWEFNGDLSRACVDLDTSGGAKATHRKSGTPSWQRRPGLMRLLEAARAGQFQHLICYKLDRLGRDAAELHQIRDAFHDAGVVIHVVSEGIRSDTPGGELVFGVLSAVAQMERRQIADRARDISLQRARRGLHHSRPPFWLSIVPGTSPADGAEHYALIEDRADRLRRVVALRLQGLSYAEISRTLNAEGLLTLKNVAWTSGSVQDALSELNRLRYRGCAVYGRNLAEGNPLRVVTAGVFPPLLDKETSDELDAAQAALISRSHGAAQLAAARRANGKGSVSLRRSEYLCSGLLFCAVCSAPMLCHYNAADEKRGFDAYRNYYCRGARDTDKEHPGRNIAGRKNGMFLGASRLETAVLGALALLQRHLWDLGYRPSASPGEAAAESDAARKRRKKAAEQAALRKVDLPKPKRSLDDIRIAIDRIVEMAENGKIDPDDFDRRYEQLRQEKRDAEEYFRQVAAVEVQQQATETLARRPEPVIDWQAAEQKLLLAQLCERIEAPIFIPGVHIARIQVTTKRPELEHVRLILRHPLKDGTTAILAGMYRSNYTGPRRVLLESDDFLGKIAAPTPPSTSAADAADADAA